MKKQMQIADLSDGLAQVMMHKKEFLQQRDTLIPWKKWNQIVKPYYYKAEHGNKPYDLELMLRIHVLQNLYTLSDMGVMGEAIDSHAFSQFCRINTRTQIPDGDTIGRFRGILVKNNLQTKFFENIVALLESKHLFLKKGTLVYSTIIHAPSSTKNREKKRDPEAKSTKKANTWHFGYKAHIGVDKDSVVLFIILKQQLLMCMM